jgi:hypothetical protein
MPRARIATFRHRLVPALALAAALLVNAGAAAGQQPLEIPRLTGPIVIDGFSDEAAWQEVPVIEPVVQTPTFGYAPSERTEFRIAYDDRYLYASARLYDADPAGIRATSLRRDDGAFSNDWFVLGLDTFNDKENLLVFGVSPAGVRTDVAVSADGTSLNFDWNTFWDAAVQVTEEGWFAEIRVPFSSLRFQERDGRVVMGVMLWRLIARRNELSIWPAIPPEWTNSFLKASQAQEMVLTGVTRSNPLYVTPYVLGGLGRVHVPAAAGDGWDPDRQRVGDIGIDLKYGVTPNLTLDLTLNTDFAQVEADDQQVNLTRFSLFFPEKRQFFQERAGIFSYPLDAPGRLFYSRRIGLVAGTPVPIYGGGRLVGRVGGWDVGLLTMQTAAEGDAAAENFGVARVRRRTLNEQSFVGGMLTTRVGSGGAYNIAAGADALVRIGQEQVTLRVAQTYDGNDDADTGALERGYVQLNWFRDRADGVLYGARVSRMGAAFDPAVGFVQRTDYLRTEGYFGYGWRPGGESTVLRHSVRALTDRYARNTDGRAESAQLGAIWETIMRSGASFGVIAQQLYEEVPAEFGLGRGVTVPAGTYTMRGAGAGYTPPASRRLRVGGQVEGGEFFDGWRLAPGASLVWDASRHFQLNAGYGYNLIEFPERDEALRIHLARLRAQLMLNVRFSVTSFVQYASLGDLAIYNLRLRYNPREGTDLYIVYNDVLNTHPTGYDPIRPRSASRTLLVKYARTLTFPF